MPNGRPGDHPLTDILVHKVDLLGDGVDQEIRALIAERPDLRASVSKILWDRNVGMADGQARGKKANTVKDDLKKLTASNAQVSTPTMTQIPRQTLATTLTTWLVRIGIVGIILYAIQVWFGPFNFLWWAWPAYAALSLAIALYGAKVTNAQADKLEALLDQVKGPPE